jgi:universal stress protein A
MKSYQHALISIDLFEHYENFLTRALSYAQRYAEQVTIIYATPFLPTLAPYAMDMQESFATEASRKMELLRERFQLGDDVACVMQLGNPKYVVTGYAKEHGVDIVLCGSHGKQGMALFLGSTSNAIVHQADCDVLTIRLDEEGHCLKATDENYHRVLLATDFYDDASQVVHTFLKVAGDDLPNAAIVTVVPDTAMLAMTYMPDLENEITQKVKTHLRNFQDKHGLSDQNLFVRAGQPKLEILKAAQDHDSDLIILGSHGRGTVMSLFLGSTANAILHGAQSDVLIVRIKD